MADDRYFSLVGNKIPGLLGDSTALFTSQDLKTWTFLGPFYESQRRWTDVEEDCAVPDFFPLGDKWMLLFCSHLQGTQYYLGQFEEDRFLPEVHGWMCWPGGVLGGPRSLLDDKGRRIYFDWIEEIRGVERERVSGWSGVMTLPRILTLAADGTLEMNPVPELEVLRMNQRELPAGTRLDSGGRLALTEFNGDCMELFVVIELDHAKQKVRLAVRCSPDGAEATDVIYDGAAGTLAIDVSRSSLDETIVYPYCRSAKRTAELPDGERMRDTQVAPFLLVPGERLEL